MCLHTLPLETPVLLFFCPAGARFTSIRGFIRSVNDFVASQQATVPLAQIRLVSVGPRRDPSGPWTPTALHISVGPALDSYEAFVIQSKDNLESRNPPQVKP